MKNQKNSILTELPAISKLIKDLGNTEIADDEFTRKNNKRLRIGLPPLKRPKSIKKKIVDRVKKILFRNKK